MCEYCENKGVLMSFDESLWKEGYLRIVENNQLEVDNDYGITRTRINYCPNCGRDLNKTLEQKINDITMGDY